MNRAYRYVRSVCWICKKWDHCIGWRKVFLGEVVDYGTLIAMANCPLWDIVKKEKEGEK